MKRNFTYLKSLLLVMLICTGSGNMWGQEVIYYETFGTSGNKTNVGDYDGWSDNLITPVSTPSGSTWKISANNTNPSDYVGASKSCNAYSGSTGDFTFNFGVKTAKYKDVVLTFGYFKGAGATKPNSLKLYISKDGGTTWSEDIIPENTSAANKWYTVTYNIDNSYLSNFAMKFSTTTNTNRIDDIKLTGTPEVSGPTTEVTPENIESAGALAPELTASGNWTQDKIETLALALSENATPVTSVKFTGSVNSASDEITALIPNCLKIFADGVSVPESWTVNVVKMDNSGNATSANISMDAAFAFGTPVTIKADQASFARENIVAGNKSTLYMPFAFTLPAELIAYTFDKVEGTTVKFTPITGTALEANTPYLITSNSNQISITEQNVDIIPAPETTPATGFEFLGTYETISAVGFYGFKDNSFKLGIAGATVPAFRAYLKPATAPSGAPAVLSIDINGEGTTGIENAVFEGTTIYATDGVVNVLTDQTQKVSIYGIDGKLVRSETVNPGMNTIGGLAKGMYVVNNQKVIIK